MKMTDFFRPHILIGSNLVHFFCVVFQLNFSLKWKAIARLFVSFFVLVLFTPFRVIEAILYFFSKKQNVKQPIFIVGHPRSGTTFFHDALNEMDNVVAPRMIDCLYPYLTKYFQFMLVPILKNVLPETRLMDKMKVAWDSPQEEEFAMALMTRDTSVSFLFAPNKNQKELNPSILLNNERVKSRWLKAHLRFAKKIQSLHKGKTLVFKSPSNTARIKELLGIYPDAKFIHIVRNPLDVIPSTIHLYQKILPEFSLQDETKIDVEAYVFDFYAQLMNKYITTKNDLHSSQLVELNYEDFVAQPIDSLIKVFNQLEISMQVKKLESFFASRKSFSRNEFELEEELKNTIKDRCDFVAKEYGY